MVGAQEAFEREMRTNGMYDNGGTAMVRDLETGGYTDQDTNAMWAGFLLAWRTSNQDAFIDGCHVGWDMSGEGCNAECGGPEDGALHDLFVLKSLERTK